MRAESQRKRDLCLLNVCDFVMCCVGCFISMNHHSNSVKDEYEALYFKDEEPEFRNVIYLADGHIRKEISLHQSFLGP